MCNTTTTDTETDISNRVEDDYERCLTFIKDAVVHSQAAKKIVVTHHVPSFRMLHS